MGSGDMTDPSDDPQLAADIAELGSLTEALRASLRGRTLTPAEWASLQPTIAGERELLTTLAFELADDDGAALRRVLGSTPEARA